MDPQNSKELKSNQKQSKQQPPTITVSSAEFIFQGKNKHVQYNISGSDPNGLFSVRRRYRQFYLLRQKLIQLFPGVYIPPIPSKRVSNTDEIFIQTRRQGLQLFCVQIAERGYLFRSGLFQAFLRQASFKKAIAPLQLTLLQSIYEQYFNNDIHHVEAMRANEEQYTKVAQLIRKLEAMRAELISISTLQTSLIDQQRICLAEALPSYQGKFLSVHNIKGEKVFAMQKDQVDNFAGEAVKYSKVKHHINTLSNDLYALRAFVEAIDGRRLLQSMLSKTESTRKKEKEEMEKLEGGKTTFKSLFTSGSKEEQVKELSERIKAREIEGEILIQLIQLSDKGIQEEIVRYKQQKKQSYVKDIQVGVKKQIQLWAKYAQVILPPLRQLQI